jgi:acyl carrier protein
MAAGDANTTARVAKTGMSLLSPSAGLAALSAGLASAGTCSSSTPVLAAVPFAWDPFLRRLGRTKPPLLAEFTAVAADRSTASLAAASGSKGKGTTKKARSAQSKPQLNAAAVQSTVEQVIATVLGRSDIGAEEPLMSAGLDSLGAVELKNSLEGSLGVSLPQTLVFDYPTKDALTRYLTATVAEESDSSKSEGAESAAGVTLVGGASGLPPLTQHISAPGFKATRASGVIAAITGLASRSAGGALASALYPADAITQVCLLTEDPHSTVLQLLWLCGPELQCSLGLAADLKPCKPGPQCVLVDPDTPRSAGPSFSLGCGCSDTGSWIRCAWAAHAHACTLWGLPARR